VKDLSFVFDRLIVVGGPPRSGTTLMASILNRHSQCVTAIDNTVYESWSLYYYRLRTGLVQELRTKSMSPKQVQGYLLERLVRNGSLCGAAASKKLVSYPLAEAPVFPSPEEFSQKTSEPMRQPSVRQRRWTRLWGTYIRKRRAKKTRLVRHCIPLELFNQTYYLCLKSPEISFALPQLAESLPGAKFVIVYRPLIEIAESMYRKGLEWSPPSYHRRWAQELDGHGRLAPPPGVPGEWDQLWRTVSDFQRCVLYAASYLRALALSLPKIPSTAVFVYDHQDLRKNPPLALRVLAGFLGIADDFRESIETVQGEVPTIPLDFMKEYRAIESQIGGESWGHRLARLDTLKKARAMQADADLSRPEQGPRHQMGF
jgi:hypothetical protein